MINSTVCLHFNSKIHTYHTKPYMSIPIFSRQCRYCGDNHSSVPEPIRHTRRLFSQACLCNVLKSLSINPLPGYPMSRSYLPAFTVPYWYRYRTVQPSCFPLFFDLKRVNMCSYWLCIYLVRYLPTYLHGKVTDVTVLWWHPIKNLYAVAPE